MGDPSGSFGWSEKSTSSASSLPTGTAPEGSAALAPPGTFPPEKMLDWADPSDGGPALGPNGEALSAGPKSISTSDWLWVNGFAPAGCRSTGLAPDFGADGGGSSLTVRSNPVPGCGGWSRRVGFTPG